jgi:hypothetical protein
LDKTNSPNLFSDKWPWPDCTTKMKAATRDNRWVEQGLCAAANAAQVERQAGDWPKPKWTPRGKNEILLCFFLGSQVKVLDAKRIRGKRKVSTLKGIPRKLDNINPNNTLPGR